MQDGVIAEISKLRRMSVPQLRAKWRELYGEETSSRSRDFLWKRLAWKIQELAYGGLSASARQRLDELAPDLTSFGKRGKQAPTTSTAGPTPSKVHDIRAPSPGTVLSRLYHGCEIRAVTLEDGFEWEGRHYRSLSAVARAVTGQRWNGPLFFRLRKRSRG